MPRSRERAPEGATAGRVARGAVVTAATIQLGVVVVVLVGRALSGGVVGDRLGAVPLAAVYGLPAVLAALAVRGRGPLLLAAGIASLLLAVFPFSLHSFVFGPAGVAYLLAYTRWDDDGPDRSRAAAAALAVPLLLVAAFLVLVVHDDPICYSRDASGEVTIDRNPDQITSRALTIEPGSDVVERGCSSDTVVWWEAAASLALSASALTASMLLTREPRRHAS